VAAFAVLAGPVPAQTSTSPFVGHWVGNEHCSYGDGAIVLDIEQASDGSMSATMKAAGVGTLHDATFSGDTITMHWSNFISRVVFVGKFVSLERVEGTYTESVMGETCTWFAVNQTPSLQPQQSTLPQQPAAQAAPMVASPTVAPEPNAQTAQEASGEPDLLKARADQDRAKLKAHLGSDTRAQAIKQFCEFAPDQAACSARIGRAFDYLTESAFATLTIASRNKAAPLPAMEPAAGLPSYYDVYQVYMFVTRDTSP
jgi:hypothetical protein